MATGNKSICLLAQQQQNVEKKYNNTTTTGTIPVFSLYFLKAQSQTKRQNVTHSHTQTHSHTLLHTHTRLRLIEKVKNKFSVHSFYSSCSPS